MALNCVDDPRYSAVAQAQLLRIVLRISGSFSSWASTEWQVVQSCEIVLPFGRLVLLVVAAEAADLAAHVRRVADVVPVRAPLDVHRREDVPAPDVAERLARGGDRVLLRSRHLRVGLRVERVDRLRDALARRLVARVVGLERLESLAADERQRGVDPPVEKGGVELAVGVAVDVRRPVVAVHAVHPSPLRGPGRLGQRVARKLIEADNL